MPSQKNIVPPAERERFRRWLSKLSACVEDALENPENVEAAAELRAMILAALAAVGSMDRHAQMTAERRERQLNTAIERIKGLARAPSSKASATSQA